MLSQVISAYVKLFQIVRFCQVRSGNFRLGQVMSG
jgi:hypothetical protein